MDCYWTSRSQASTVSFSRRKEYLVNIFENFMWKYAVHWYGDFMGGLCQYIKSDQMAKRFTEIFCSTIRDHDEENFAEIVFVHKELSIRVQFKAACYCRDCTRNSANSKLRGSI